MLVVRSDRSIGDRIRVRAWPRLLLLFGTLLAVSFIPRDAHAFTWMIKHGYGGCTTCHADPSGGELLTPYGRAQSDLLLRMHYGKDNASAEGSQKGGGHSGSFDSFDSFDNDEDKAADGEGTASKTKGAAKNGDAKPSRAAKAKKDSDDDDDDNKSSGAANAKGDSDDDAKPSAPAKAKKDSDDDDDDAPATGAGDAPKSAKAAPDASGKAAELDSSSGFLWGLITPPDWLLLGGSYRHLTLYEFGSKRFATFPMQADLYGQLVLGGFRAGGSIGAIRVPEGSPYARAAQVTRNQGDQWNLLSRTHYIGYEFEDGEYFLRAGRLNLPFGIRIPEHTMWVRSATRTDRESSQEDGLALAFNGSVVRGEVMAIAGNYQINPDKFRERGYSLYVEYLVASRSAIGVSSEVTYANRDRIIVEQGSMLRQAHGLFARTAISDKTVLLAEADFLNRSFAAPGYVGFAQLDWEAVQGLHFMVTGEGLDNGYDANQNVLHAPGNGQPMLGGWGTIDWFFLPHLEFRFDAVAQQQSHFTLLGQLHAFL
ncbi:MAG TPA: hypothetical protein VGM29_09220 [Polyangiaceae bacterium]|jgi:hypothetical protein